MNAHSLPDSSYYSLSKGMSDVLFIYVTVTEAYF